MAVLGRWTGGTIGTMQPGTSWAAPNGLFPTQQRNDSSTYTWTSSTSTVTIPASGLPDGYLLKAGFEFEDSSNGRHNPMGKFVQASGTSDGFVSTEVSGYNRDASEDRAFVNVSAFVAGPSASSTFQFQWIRGTDAPNASDGTVQSYFEIIPIWFSNIGMYTSSATTKYSGATPTQITLDTVVYESDTAAIQMASNEATIKTDNKRYLILGGYRQKGGGTRTQKISAITYDGTEDSATRGYSYIRSTANDFGGALSWDIKERVTTDIDVGYAVWSGPTTYAADNGAAENTGATPSSAHASLVIIELNDDAEVFRTKDDTGLQSDSATPTDLNISRTSDIDFNDSASWTRASDTAMNAVVTMDAFIAGNVWTARSTSSGSRRTTRGHITINGTEQASTLDGCYSRGDQSTSGTFAGGFNPAGFLALTAGDDVGMSQTAIAGTEGGTPRTQPGTVGLIGINLDTLEASGGTDIEVTAATETLSLSSTNTTVVTIPEVHFEMSAGAGSDGAAVTSRITGLSGTLGGRFTESANPSGTAVDLDASGHRIDTWSIEATSLALDGETYEFRVLYGGSAADTITQTPEVTISAGGDTEVTATTETLTLSPTNTTVVTEIDTVVTATTDSLSLTPTNTTVNVEIDTIVTAGTETLSLSPTNTNVVVEVDTPVNATTETLTISTTNATVQVFQDVEVTATNETLTITPTDPTVVVETDTVVDAGTESLTITPTNTVIVIEQDTPVTAGSESLTLTPTPAVVVVEQDYEITVGTETLTITPTNASVFTGTELNINAGSQALNITPTNPTVDIETDTSIISGTGTLTLTPTNPTVLVEVDTEVTAGTETLNISVTNPAVSYVPDATDYSADPAAVEITFDLNIPTVVLNRGYQSDPDTASATFSTSTPDVVLTLPIAYTSEPETAIIEAKVKWRLGERPQTEIARSVKYGSDYRVFKPRIPI